MMRALKATLLASVLGATTGVTLTLIGVPLPSALILANGVIFLT